MTNRASEVVFGTEISRLLDSGSVPFPIFFPRHLDF